jgi:hypothetical protein
LNIHKGNFGYYDYTGSSEKIADEMIKALKEKEQ